MLVRKYSVISIFKDMCREKKMIIIITIACVLLGGAIGFLTYQKELKEQINLENQIDSKQTDGEEDYITELRNYEESMVACEEAYSLAVEQRDVLQEYVDSSIVMKIDPNNVQVAYVSYVVQENGNTGNILNALQSYINDGGLKEDAKEKGTEELEVESWREAINVGTTGNNLFITISHYDADKVKEIMKIVKECVEAQNEVISRTHGFYKLVLCDEAYYIKIDANIANAQIANNNNLKAYENSVADQLIKINNLTNTINDYKTKYEIKEGASVQRGLLATVLLYCVFSLAGGLVLSFVITFIRASVSNKIMSAQHLQYAGLTVYNIYYQNKKEFKGSIDVTVSEIERLIKNSNGDKVCLWSLSDDDRNKEITDRLKDRIQLEVKNNAGLCDCKDVLVVLTEKKDTYSALEELMMKCSRLDINLLGIVVSE